MKRVWTIAGSHGTAPELVALVALSALGAGFYFIGNAPLALVALAGFAVVAWFRPIAGLGAVVVFVPYFMQPKTLFGHHFAIDEALLAVVVMIGVAMSVLSVVGGRAPTIPGLRRPNWRRLRGSRYVWPGACFVVAVAISAVFAAQPHLAFREFGEVVIEPVLFFILLVLFAPTDGGETIWILGFVVAVAGLAPALIGIGQLFSGHGSTSQGSYVRVHGPYASPDNFGLLLDRSLPMAIALALGAWAAEAKGALFALVGGVASLLGIALVLTFVVGAWGGCAVAIVALLAIWFQRVRVVGIAAIALVVAGLLLILTPVGQSLLQHHSVTSGQRIDIWTSAVHMLKTHWLVGVGPDNFHHYYAPKREPYMHCSHGLGYGLRKAVAAEPCTSHPHNLILDFWLSSGIAGLISFGWLVLVFWRGMWERRGLLRTTPVMLGCGAAILAGLTHGLVDNSYFLIDLSLFTWLLLGMEALAPVAASGNTGRFREAQHGT